MKHTCHWHGCQTAVPPAMWGCRAHWLALPKSLRDRIWATYVPGQEITKTPSAAYLDAARDVQEWIAEKGEMTAPRVLTEKERMNLSVASYDEGYEAGVQVGREAMRKEAMQACWAWADRPGHDTRQDDCSCWHAIEYAAVNIERLP